LETAAFDPSGTLTAVAIVARLHLPVTPGSVEPEPEDRANAVKLSFVNGKLDAVAIAPLDPDDDNPPPTDAPVNEWPLAAGANAPVVRWTDVALNPDKSA